MAGQLTLPMTCCNSRLLFSINRNTRHDTAAYRGVHRHIALEMITHGLGCHFVRLSYNRLLSCSVEESIIEGVGQHVGEHYTNQPAQDESSFEAIHRHA